MDIVDPSGAATGALGQPDDAASATRRSQDLRASLDAIVTEAERVSEQLMAESRASAAATTREADERASEILEQARNAADVIRTRAESDVEEYRRRVRVEVQEQVRVELVEQNRRELAAVRAQSQAVIGDLEASVRILGVSMESAVANIAEMLSALEQLRSHTGDPMPSPASQVSPTRLDATPEPPDPLVDPVAQPSFAQTAQPASVPAPSVAFNDPDAVVGGVPEPEPEPPRAPITASEAFLNASAFKVDVDSEEGSEPRERERDRGLEDRRHESSEDVEADPAKPLGWLFRSPE